MANKITFIIPTIGRRSLPYAITSIINQTNNNWQAIIIFDGIKPTIEIDDERVTIMQIDKKGIGHNSAGLVRNMGIEHVKTEWIGFLDDDDYLTNDYIDSFYKELSINSDADVVIFRMIYSNGEILPELETDNFYVDHVGISFAIKKTIYDSSIHLHFVPSTNEDFQYLNKIRQNNYKMVISPYVTYLVSHCQQPQQIDRKEGNRVKINYIMYISLGYNCAPRIYMKNSLELTKGIGYQSCPFDLCITPFNGLYDCLESNFAFFFNELKLVDGCNAEGDRSLCGSGNKNIVNLYSIIFNHEGSTHSHLFKTGRNDDEFYIRNDFEEFKKRYSKRIKNFYSNINSSNCITFICHGYTEEQVDKLLILLRHKFPNKEINILYI